MLICIIQVAGTQAGTWPDKLVLRPGLCAGAGPGSARQPAPDTVTGREDRAGAER